MAFDLLNHILNLILTTSYPKTEMHPPVSVRGEFKGRKGSGWRQKKGVFSIENQIIQAWDPASDIATSAWSGRSVRETSGSVRSLRGLLRNFIVSGEEAENERRYNQSNLTE